ncbi:BRO-N domain-containing protein [Cecembia calidifontis]|uniref:BRO-N domain-containing protein n=1 Tax=Cecembia calidifontis TaxID=1187080 RepID=UPI001F5ED1D1|nr:BRO family protein [Cecembia calidifontis]
MFNSKIIILEKINNKKRVSRLFGHPPDGMQTVTIISESGLFELVGKSRKPEAKAFRKWVNKEVLPTIRKTGAYMTPLLGKTILRISH